VISLIISRTPVRISFVGGGTDLPGYYKTGFGAVVSTTIQNYIYVIAKQRFENSYRISYSETEIASSLNDIKHDLIRESIRSAKITDYLEILTIADIPGRGTGLGSSGSLAVGLLNALYSYIGINQSKEFLASEACRLEINILKRSCGKQDQYAASYGGLNYIQFNKDESVIVEPIKLSSSTLKELEDNLMLFYTNITRPSESILPYQAKNIPRRIEILDKMRDQALYLRDMLRQNDISELGALLHQGWLYKRQLAKGISNPIIDSYYNKARKAGAIGGKISGAGGGGFLLLYVLRRDQDSVRKALFNLREVSLRLDSTGTRIIYSTR